MPAAPELKKIAPEPKKTFEKELGLELEKKAETENLELRALAFLKGGHIDIPELGQFDPNAEIAEIRKAIKESPANSQSAERLLMMEDFKRKLKIFRENLAKAQLDFENLLRNNLDKDSSWLEQEMLHILQKYSVQSQEEVFFLAENRFYNVHRYCKETAAEYQEKFGENWENELFKKLFGRWPLGAIKIETMPVNLYFRIFNRRDYILANQGEEENAQNNFLGLQSTGASLNREMPLAQLNNTILLENSSLNLSSAEHNAIVVHEEEHAIHKFYPSLAMIKYESGLVGSAFLEGEVSFDQFYKAMERRTRLLSLIWEKSAKSEVLAFLKDRRLTLEEAEENILWSELYHYLDINGQIEHVFRSIAEHGVMIKTKDENGYLDQQEVEEEITKALKNGWNMYQLRINKAVLAADELIKEYIKQDGEEKGLMRALRLLSQEPLNKWWRLAKLMFNS